MIVLFPVKGFPIVTKTAELFDKYLSESQRPTLVWRAGKSLKRGPCCHQLDVVILTIFVQFHPIGNEKESLARRLDTFHLSRQR